MISFFSSFFSSFIANIFIIWTQKIHLKITGDLLISGPQKFHVITVPRIGGLAIGFGVFIALSTSYILTNQTIDGFSVFICAIPALGIGLAEDLSKNISVKSRLFFIAVGSLIAVIFLKCQVTSIDIPGVDFILLIPGISIFFTIIAITGLSNAYNIIDGFNGLSSMTGIITLSAIGYLCFRVEDLILLELALVMIGSVMGFLLLNYPRGLIFLGDGGAYLIGFWIAILSILLIDRHQEISPWFALLVNAYPVVETTFTIYRRKIIKGKNPGQPDAMHLHSLIYRRIISRQRLNHPSSRLYVNSKTAPFLWGLSSMPIIPAILFYEHTPILVMAFIVFFCGYLLLYKSLITFKHPKRK
jgi:UDP-N-acetylmuramyl pentapeptide phosphotransferase/UDP-N-acetylglucosamine-1-phosphate transferase